MMRVQRLSAIVLVLGAGLLLAALTQCGGLRRFPLEEPMWEDPDRQHVEVRPEEYWSPFAWDGLDQMVFRPLTRIFAVDPPGASANVNAFDEVPDSSWWTNRIGMHEMTLEEVRRGACPEDRIDWSGPWVVTDAKPNGANPGFIIRAADGRRYLMKMDGYIQPERATSADVFGSRLYHAVGFYAPCNFIVFFDRDQLEMDPEAESEDALGFDIPMTDEDVETVLAASVVQADGRYRASVSLFLPGRPIGPFRYEGTLSDDPNDVIPHQDRRELRGGRVLAAWLNHFDAREQNTLSIWMEEDDGTTYVRHNYIDFGDCFGSDWDFEMLTARLGFSNYFDLGDVTADLFTLGLLSRPWEQVRRSEVAPIFAYFDAAHFEPDDWEPGYPNPTFLRMQPEDGAWMARILAHVSDEHLRAMLDEAEISNPEWDAELYRILLGRRDRIYDDYLRVRSPLAHFEVRDGDELCFTDLGAATGTFDMGLVGYRTRMYFGDFDEPRWERVESIHGHVGSSRVCVEMTEAGARPAAEAQGAASASPDRYAVLDLVVVPEPGAEPIPPARLHFYDLGGDEGFRLVGIERPEDDEAPGNP